MLLKSPTGQVVVAMVYHKALVQVPSRRHCNFESKVPSSFYFPLNTSLGLRGHLVVKSWQTIGFSRT